jgi:hypothetical protein
MLFHIPLGVYPTLVAVKQETRAKVYIVRNKGVCTLRNKGCTLFFIIHFALLYIFGDQGFGAVAKNSCVLNSQRRAAPLFSAASSQHNSQHYVYQEKS